MKWECSLPKSQENENLSCEGIIVRWDNWCSIIMAPPFSARAICLTVHVCFAFLAGAGQVGNDNKPTIVIVQSEPLGSFLSSKLTTLGISGVTNIFMFILVAFCIDDNAKKTTA